MAINFASVRPGIDLFNANVARGDAQRSQEEHDFERRMQMEQAQGADRGMRNAISAYYAQKQAPVTPVQTTAFQPTPAAIPNPAATTPIVSPDQSMNPADNPDYGGPTSAAPMPNAAPRAGVDVPATIAAPPVPAAAAAPGPTQPAPGTRSGPGGSFGPMMGELAKQPGTGQAMMHMFSTDLTSQRAAAVEERKQKFEAEKLVYEHITKGDWRVAKSVNDQYRLGIPDEVFQHRGAQQLMTLGARMADLMGEKVKGATIEHKMAYMQGFAENMAQTNDEAQAHAAGMKAAQAAKPEFEATHWAPSPSGEQLAFSKQGAVKHTGQQVRLPREAAGGDGAGGSKQQQFAEWRIKTLVASGVPEADARKMVAGGTATRPMTEQQRLSLARNLMNQRDRTFKPLYPSLQHALKAVDEATGRGEQPGAPAAGTGGPATAGPAGAAPDTGAPIIDYDANGRRVSK